MKKYTYITIVTVFLFMISCSVIDNLLTFTISKDAAITIPKGIPVGVSIPGVNQDITTNSTAEFENNDTNVNLVKDFKLKEFTLTMPNISKFRKPALLP